jgi:hypothetical protein
MMMNAPTAFPPPSYAQQVLPQPGTLESSTRNPEPATPNPSP